MEAKVYNKQGEVVDQTVLDDRLFALPWNADLVHQVFSAMRNNARSRVADAKDRSEVRGGGKKPWRQKGTGRARHGSNRSPIWVGGGVTHGPSSERNFACKINKKMKDKALFVVLSQKVRDGELLLVDDLGLSTGKTSQARQLLSALKKVAEKIDYRTGRRLLVATTDKHRPTEKSFANIGSAMVQEIRNLNPKDLLIYKYLLIEKPQESLAVLSGRKRVKSKK